MLTALLSTSPTAATMLQQKTEIRMIPNSAVLLRPNFLSSCDTKISQGNKG